MIRFIVTASWPMKVVRVLIERSRRAPNFKNRTDEAIELMSRCLEEFATVTLRKRLSAWFLSIRALFIRW